MVYKEEAEVLVFKKRGGKGGPESREIRKNQREREIFWAPLNYINP